MPDALKQLVGEDVYKQHIEPKLGAEKKYFFGEGEFIPKGRFDEVNNQVKDLKTQIAERDKQLEDLKKAAANNDELKKKIDELTDLNKKTREEYEKKIAEKEYEYEFEKSLSAAKPKDVKILKALIDQSKVTYKDGKFYGLSEQIEALKKSHDYVFEAEQSPKPALPTSSGLQPAGGKVVPSAAGNQAQQQQTIQRPWNRRSPFKQF